MAHGQIVGPGKDRNIHSINFPNHTFSLVKLSKCEIWSNNNVERVKTKWEIPRIRGDVILVTKSQNANTYEICDQ